MGWTLTISRNDAKVNWNALMIQMDWLSDIPMDISSAGIAEKRAELLKQSKNCARQNRANKISLRVGESFLGSWSTSVSAGEKGGSGSIAPENYRQYTVVGRFRSDQLTRGRLETFSVEIDRWLHIIKGITMTNVNQTHDKQG
jgi:hypothetical protein